MDSLNLSGRYHTLTDLVTRELRDALLSGAIDSGERLRIGDLARRFGVSPIPVREALRRLDSEGLVVIQPHRGVIVPTLTRDELAELYEIRIRLEGLAVGLATERISEEQVQKLAGLVGQMDETNDTAEWLNLNDAFHTLLYRASDRPRLCALIDTLRRNVERYLRIYIGSMRRAAKANREHRQILRAVQARDSRRAQETLERHLESTFRALLRYLPGTSPARPLTRARRTSRPRAAR